MKVILNCLKFLNIKTIYFNFKYFSFLTAVKLPVFVSSNVYLKDMRGNITIPVDSSVGMIKIGYGDVGIFDKKKSRSVWEVSGTIIFQGLAFIGHGAKICVGKDGHLLIGSNFVLSAESSIISFKRVVIGKDCLISWDNLIIDTDFHKIVDLEEKHLNQDREIVIGNHVWISARCTILKGAVIPNGSVIAANSLVAGELKDELSLYAGIPAVLKRTGIKWIM
jgi:carbonic anhydrase/acetyltransferase-like protein (isoleucine patch superfamily)